MFERAILTCCIAFGALASAASAATYHVSPSGDDARVCSVARDASTPRKTLAGGVKCMAGGDTLIVAEGTYEQGFLNVPPGTPAAYTTLRAATGARPKIVRRPLPEGLYDRGFWCAGRKCAYIELRGFEFSDLHNGVKTNGDPTSGYPHHFRIIDNVFHNGGVAILIASSHRGFEGGDHLIQGNLFYEVGSHAPGYGPGMNTIYNPGNRTVIEKNEFRNCTFGIGIWSEAGNHIRGVVIRGNRFHDMGRFDVNPWQIPATSTTRGSGGIHITVPGGEHQIYNNLFYRSGPPSSSARRFVGIRVGLRADSATTAVIYNNTFHDFLNSRSAPVVVEPQVPAANVTVRNNILFQAGSIEGGVTQSHNLVSDPIFVNASNGDFRLQPGSPAIDRGTNVSPVVTTDFSELGRPQGGVFDIGAFEYKPRAIAKKAAAPTMLRIR